MKLSEGFMLREMAGQWVVVPIGNAVVDMNCIITLSPSAALLWKELEIGVDDVATLAGAIMKEYDIDYETALNDSEEFIAQLKEIGMLE